MAGYIKVNDIKFDIQPSFQLIYYWIEKKKLNISPLDLVHKAKLEKKENLILANPGSISIPKDEHHSYMVMDEKGITLYDLLTEEDIKHISWE